MERTPKPYYPGFRDMNLFLAFGLTLLFFALIWLVVLAARLIGLRRRIEGFDSAIAEAQMRLEQLRNRVVAEAAFATAPVQTGEPEALVRLLQASGRDEYVKQADLLSDLGKALRHVEEQRERAALEYERLIRNPVAARMAVWLAKPRS